MNTLTNLSACVLAGSLLLAGCDGLSSDRSPQRVSVDVSPLFRASPDAPANHCRSAAEEIVLTVTDEGGKARDYRRTLTLEEAAVVFEVEVEAGETEFDVAVWSNNETLLYSGQTTAEVEDGFEVTVPLTKQAAVLQVCPSALTLVSSGNGFFGEFVLYNRGNSPLLWQALPPAQQCDGEPCVSFDPGAGVVAAGESAEVPVGARPGFGGNTTMQVVSPVGSVVLDVNVL